MFGFDVFNLDLTMLSNFLYRSFLRGFMNLLKKIKPGLAKTISKKEPEFTTECRICGMEFSDPERTKRHMIKAHSKPKKEKRR